VRSSTVSSGTRRVCFVPAVPAGFDAGGMPLCELPFSSKLPKPFDGTRVRTRVHLSWGSIPLQRSKIGGARISRRRAAAGTIRPQGFPPSRRLSSPSTLPWISRRPLGRRSPQLALLGLTRDPLARHDLAIKTGRKHHGVPLQGSLRCRDERVLARSPLLRFGSLPPFSFREKSGLDIRALQSLDRRTVGSSPIASQGHRPS